MLFFIHSVDVLAYGGEIVSFDTVGPFLGFSDFTFVQTTARTDEGTPRPPFSTWAGCEDVIMVCPD